MIIRGDNIMRTALFPSAPPKKAHPNPVAPTLSHQWSWSATQILPLRSCYLHLPKVPISGTHRSILAIAVLERNPSTATSKFHPGHHRVGLDWLGWTGLDWLRTGAISCLFPRHNKFPNPPVSTVYPFTILCAWSKLISIPSLTC